MGCIWITMKGWNEMAEKIKALLFEPGKKPKDTEIENSLEAFQEAVKGYIETLNISETVVLIANEEGLIRRMKPCVMVSIPVLHGALSCSYRYTTLVGPVVAVGVQGDEFRSLTRVERDFVLAQVRPI